MLKILLGVEATGEQNSQTFPSLPLYSVLRDVFLESAFACGKLLEQINGTRTMQAEKEQKIEPVKESWKPPKRYIGSKTIVNEYEVPRTTLQGWAERDKTEVKKDLQTQECYYPKKWFNKRFKNYRPRKPKT
jgi:hypothetical protein